MAAKTPEAGDDQTKTDWLMSKGNSLFGSYHFDVPALCRTEEDFLKNKYRLHKREVWIFPTKATVLMPDNTKAPPTPQVMVLKRLEAQCKLANDNGTYNSECCYENFFWMTGFMRVIKYYQH